MIGLLERREFDAARSNEAADGNAVATFVPQVGGHPVCEGREGGNGTHVANAGAIFNELEAEHGATKILIAC